MKYGYTEIPTDVFDNLAVEAGVLLTEFSPESPAADIRDKILLATSGGINASCVPEYEDFGADIDNAPKNTKELKRIVGWTCKMSGTGVSVSTAVCKALLGAADVTGTKITPRADLKSEDFTDLWYVCPYGSVDGGYIAIRLMNALSTGGFAIHSTDRAKGKFAFEFTGHTSMADIKTIPMEFYIKAQEA